MLGRLTFKEHAELSLPLTPQVYKAVLFTLVCIVHHIFLDEPVVVPVLEHLVESMNDAIIRHTHKMRILLPEHCCCLFQFVMWDFDKEVVDLMCAYVVD